MSDLDGTGWMEISERGLKGGHAKSTYSVRKNAISDGCSTVVLNRIGWTGWVASLGGVRCRAPHMTDGKKTIYRVIQKE